MIPAARPVFAVPTPVSRASLAVRWSLCRSRRRILGTPPLRATRASNPRTTAPTARKRTSKGRLRIRIIRMRLPTKSSSIRGPGYLRVLSWRSRAIRSATSCARAQRSTAISPMSARRFVRVPREAATVAILAGSTATARRGSRASRTKAARRQGIAAPRVTFRPQPARSPERLVCRWSPAPSGATAADWKRSCESASMRSRGARRFSTESLESVAVPTASDRA